MLTRGVKALRLAHLSIGTPTLASSQSNYMIVMQTLHDYNQRPQDKSFWLTNASCRIIVRRVRQSAPDRYKAASNGAHMSCDPQEPQSEVVFSQYRCPLKRI